MGWIRSTPDAPYAYVLVLAAESDEGQARAAMEAGADDLVIKPLDPAELERKLSPPSASPTCTGACTPTRARTR